MSKVSFGEANARTAATLGSYCEQFGISTEGQNIRKMKQALIARGVDSTTVNHIAGGKALTTAENEELQKLISGSGNQPVPEPVSETHTINSTASAADAAEQNAKVANDNYEQAKANAAEKKKAKIAAEQRYKQTLKDCEKAKIEAEKANEWLKQKHVGNSPEESKALLEEYKNNMKKVNRHKKLSMKLKKCASEYKLALGKYKQSLTVLSGASKQMKKVVEKGSNLAKEVKGVRKSAKGKIRSIRFNQFKNFMESMKGRATIFGVVGLAIAISIGAMVYNTLEDKQEQPDLEPDNIEEENNETPVETQGNVQQNAEQPDSADNANAVTGEPVATTSEESATTGTSDNGDAEIAEAEEVAAQVDEQVKKYSYNPGEAYKVEKGDCLWNIVKGLLKDKLGTEPTDKQILEGVRKWVEEDETLAYTDDTH